MQTAAHYRTHNKSSDRRVLIYIYICFFILLQFGFSFIETHTVKAVRLRPRSHGNWADDVSEENEECDSKTMPIISSEGTYPWNIDGDLLEAPSELLIR